MVRFLAKNVYICGGILYTYLSHTIVMKRTLLYVVLSMLASTLFAATPSGSLPVVNIVIDGHNLDYIHTHKDTYVTASLWVIDPAGKLSLGSETEPVTLKIKGRGNYTWTAFDKKPYRLKFDAKQPLLGMNKDKNFGLLAHADDNRGFLRNPAGFRLSEIVGLAWTPAQVPCELVVNGEYRGLYFATELIKDGKKRVDISENFEKEVVESGMDDGVPVSIPADYYTGGWIVEIDNYNTSPHVTVIEQGSSHAGNAGNKEIWLTYDKMVDNATDAQKRFLTEQFTRINALIWGDADNDDELWTLLDLDDTVRFYIVQELSDNTESYHGSCYLWRERTSVDADARWHFGPVWDFGSAFAPESKWESIANCCNYDTDWHQIWIPALVRHPRFMKRVKEIYNEIYPSLASVDEYLSDYAAGIESAAQADSRRWSYNNGDPVQMAERVSRMLRSSRAWLARQGWREDESQAYSIYLCDPEGVWNAPYVWIWETANPGVNYTGGKWPGKAMTRIAGVGDVAAQTLTDTPEWCHTLVTDVDPAELSLVISGWKNAEDAAAARDKIGQTPDLAYKPGYFYDIAGNSREGVENVVTDHCDVSVVAGEGCVVVTAYRACRLIVATCDGRSAVRDVVAGINILPLSSGFYIIRGEGLPATRVLVR